MARARNIKPGFFRDEHIVELPFEARLLFIGLWTLADREGRLKDRPNQIKIDIFPCDNVKVDKLLDQLAEKRFIIRYQVDGERYIQVVNFTKHQNPHIKESASEIPAPDIHSASTVQTPEKQGSCTADSLSLDSLNLIPDSLNPIKDIVPVAEIIDYMNIVCGTNFKPTTKATKEHINARWREGFRLDDFKRVIDNKARDWINDPKMSKFLRPATLFGTKFEGYLNQVEAQNIPDAWHEIRKFAEEGVN